VHEIWIIGPVSPYASTTCNGEAGQQGTRSEVPQHLALGIRQAIVDQVTLEARHEALDRLRSLGPP